MKNKRGITLISLVVTIVILVVLAGVAINLTVGENVKIWGRIQSRQYEKKFEDGTSEIRRAYEVSVSKMEIEKVEEIQKKELTYIKVESASIDSIIKDLKLVMEKSQLTSQIH